MGNEFCGTCCGTDSVAVRSESLITTEIKNKTTKYRETAIKKILLLGAGNVGKTTITKQLCKLYGAGHSDKVLYSYTHHIHQQIIYDMHYAIAYLEKMNETKQLSESGKAIAEQFKNQYDVCVYMVSVDIHKYPMHTHSFLNQQE